MTYAPTNLSRWTSPSIPTHLPRWTRPENYFGKEWPEYYSSGFSLNRDSDALERSNFRCALLALGGESETVTVVRESHFLVSWVEWIAIHESDGKALQAADELRRDSSRTLRQPH